ncbi:amino acid adenylation domain-containing protein [Micromonospora sp. NPDC007271]|uniref:amino acid adenylation domain-containing protein n=1 Tax=Micromonospora sp. NPDC007271 TaxID=3154587 RepID=UPI0033D65746
MSVATLIDELRDAGIELWEEAGQLRFRAPKGAMTAQRRDAVREHREEILAHLRARAVTLIPGPDGRYQPFPLTDVQAAYLVGRHDAYGSGGTACQVYGELSYPDLDPDRLARAWNALIARHDMLRATVHPEGHQQVAAEVPQYNIPVTDLRDGDDDQLAAAVEAVRAELSHREYEPARWPLFELRVTRSPRRSVLHVSVDFLIADYLSIQRLLVELHQLYADPDAVLPPLDITFRDYVLAERRLRDGGRYERDRAYWWDRLDELPPAPELPARPEAASGRFERRQSTLDPAAWAAFRRHAASRGLTPSAAVLAAYAEVIGRWSRHPRFTLNLTLLNRQQLHEQVEHLVGDFTTVSLLACDTTPDAPFHRRAAALAAQLFDDMDHRLCSGVTVLRELARRRGREAALMPVVFTSTIGLGEADGGEFEYGISQTPQVWIDCQAVERAGGLVLTWDVREGVFPPGLVADAFAALAGLLADLAAGEAAWDADSPVPLNAEQQRRRQAANDTDGPLPDGLLHAPVLAQAARTPGRLAVRDARVALTYGELVARAGAVAAALRVAGCAPGDRVAVVMDKGAEQVVAVLGALAAGAVYVPIDTVQPPARRAGIIVDAGVRHVLTQPWLADGPWPDGVTAHPVDATAPVEPGTTDLGDAAGAGPDDPAYVIYTSGSTGTPKGVVISHRGALNTIVDINDRFRVGSGDRVLGLANLGFDLSVYDIFGLLAVGGAVVLPDPARRGDPSHWADLVARHEVTVWNSVPAQLQMLAHYLDGDPEVRLPALRLALLSGDWIPVPLPDAVRARVPGLEVVSLGGATEASIWSIHHRIGEVDRERPSIPYGTPLTNQRFHVLDQAGRPCPEWVPGELYIGGAGLALGYLGDPARTAERFVTHTVTGERLYRTGDLGRYWPDGSLEFLGREDSQVKIRGHRIELAEIETALRAHPAVADAVCEAVGERLTDRRLAAFVQPERIAPDRADAEWARDVVTAARAEGEHARSGVDPQRFVEFAGLLDTAALASMAATLHRHGLFATPGASHDLADVVAATGAAEQHHRLLRRWLAALTAEGHLTRDGDRYTATRSFDPAWAEQAWQAVHAAGADVDQAPVLTRYFAESAERHGELLRDEIDPLRALFPEGSLEIGLSAYRDSAINRYVNAVATETVRAVAQAHAGPAPLRLLEIGAGVGGVSHDVIPALRGLSVEYLFTDVTPFFLNEARARFADDDWVTFALFDMNQDYRAQGLAPNSLDVVLCNNALHYARHLPRLFDRLRELLRPGGWLVFIDQTRDNYQIMSSMEFVEAQADFEDERRGRAETFLPRADWLRLLADADAELVGCLPEPDDVFAPLGQAVFVARFKRDRSRIDPDDLGRHLAERLPEYMLPSQVQQVDALPLTGNGKVDRAALRGWLPHEEDTNAAGHEPRDELEQRLAALWAELLQRPRVGRNQDFFQSGGDSLLVSQLAARLRERVPEASRYYFDSLLRQILREPTVAALAEFLRRPVPEGSTGEAPATPASPLVPLGGDGDGPSWVVVHDATGTMAPFVALARELAGTAPTFGLAVTKVDAYLDVDPATLVERLAARYAELLLAHDRPVHLLGYGSGGSLAVEVARNLLESGHPPAGLTLLDGYPLPIRVTDDLLVEYEFARVMGVDPARLGFPADVDAVRRAIRAALPAGAAELSAGAIAGLDGTDATVEDDGVREVAATFRKLAEVPQPERLGGLARALTHARPDLDAEGFVGAQYRVFRHSLAAFGALDLQPYLGDLALLRTTAGDGPLLADDPESDWRDLCLGEVAVGEIPGDHFACLREPHAAAVARAVHAAARAGADHPTGAAGEGAR